jgi:hypothetical protein
MLQHDNSGDRGLIASAGRYGTTFTSTCTFPHTGFTGAIAYNGQPDKRNSAEGSNFQNELVSDNNNQRATEIAGW